MAYYGMIAALALAAVAVVGIFFVIAKMRALSSADAIAPLAQRLDAVANSLENRLAETRADIAQRLGSVKGELHLDISGGLDKGFIELKDAVGKQLAEGREEQSKSLGRELGALGEATTKSLEGIRAEVDKKLLAIGAQVQEKLDHNIKEGFAQFEKVQEHLKKAEEQLRNVGEVGASINDLNNLLKLPHLRGRFGEESLERLLEDFLPAHMFEFQAAPAPGVAGRVDAIIKFPDRNLPIDAKFPREQVEGLFGSGDPAALEDARLAFERVMKDQAKRISGYISPESGTTDMALMYLPSETLYMEAVRSREVSEYLNKLQVFAASPNTLIVTLKSIQMVFNMYEYAKGFEKATEELKKAQRAFGYFENRFEDIGKSLGKAQDAYQVARGHLTKYRNNVVNLTAEPVPELEAPSKPDQD